MARVETDLGGRLIYTWMEQADFAATGALPSDSEDVINMTLEVGRTEGAVIFVEQPGGAFKVSFRSRCRMNCAEVAQRFGGGGHRAAAGATIQGDLESVRQRVLDAVRTAMGP
jgi:bifunctional oligoribonuclease and PAP phosphatase NrnA